MRPLSFFLLSFIESTSCGFDSTLFFKYCRASVCSFESHDALFVTAIFFRFLSSPAVIGWIIDHILHQDHRQMSMTDSPVWVGFKIWICAWLDWEHLRLQLHLHRRTIERPCLLLPWHLTHQTIFTHLPWMVIISYLSMPNPLHHVCILRPLPQFFHHHQRLPWTTVTFIKTHYSILPIIMSIRQLPSSTDRLHKLIGRWWWRQDYSRFPRNRQPSKAIDHLTRIEKFKARRHPFRQMVRWQRLQ